ncbi:hypothetical protein FRC02_005257 [Tulasnella sp. 418]|nr:hypothetical protein FRC02_005257 [Tulasnella sp. 418]
MNLRVIPAVASAPTVIFSLNWHSLPSALPFPHYYSSQLVACQENSIHPPRNSLALDKAVGFMVLIDSVTFDLSKDLVTVACNDGQSYQWSISQVGGFKDALEAVLKCVKDSGVEAEKEKKAAAAAALAAANPKTVAPSASQESIPSSTASTSSSSSSTKRHRTASGIFSSLVASFITPTSSSSQSDTSSPAHLAHLYAYRQRRKSSQTFHKQHVDHPSNPRQTFNTSPVPQSRFLRRQARAKLVDIFRFYVASVLNEKMREHGIVGEELKSRGILDDLDEEHAVGDVSDAQSGVGGYTSAGGYVGYMARSQLRNAFAEFAKEQAVSATSSDDHSSSDESILLTPKTESDNSLSFESSATSPRGRRPSSRTSSATSVQSLKIRQLSAVLIGMTQREKRNAEEEKETMDEIKDRSLRRRWSLHEKSRLGRRVGGAVLNTYANLAGTAVPVISSPLREVVVAQDEEEESRPVEVKVVKEKASEDEIIIVMDKRRDEAETAVVKSSEKVDIPSIVVEEIREEITFPSSAVEVSQLESIPFPSVGPIPSRRAKSLPPSATPPVLANDDDDESGELELPELVSEPKEKQRDINDHQSILSSTSVHGSSSKSAPNGGSPKASSIKSTKEENIVVGSDRNQASEGSEPKRARRVALPPSTPSPTSSTSAQSSLGSPTSPTTPSSERTTSTTPPLSPSSTFSSPERPRQGVISDEKTAARSLPSPTSPSSCPSTPDSFRSKSCPLPESSEDNWFRGSPTYVAAPRPKSKHLATYEVAPPSAPAAPQDSFLSHYGAASAGALGLGLEFGSEDGVLGSTLVGTSDVFWTHFGSDNGKRSVSIIRNRGERQGVLVA